SGRRVARPGRSLHPVSGRTHPHGLRRQSGKVAYPRLPRPVNHGVGRRRTTERLNRASDGELEGLSHFVTEPAVKAHVRAHPAVAARLFRALCMRILNSGKSKYYYAALANLEEARRC